MPPCEHNPSCTNKHCPIKTKVIKQGAYVPEGKFVAQTKDPDSYLRESPSWVFGKADNDGNWPVNISCFWNEIVPKLISFESMKWGDILIRDKNNNHAIKIPELNKCARDRLKELGFEEEEIVSLRFSGKIRLYGILPSSRFIILWYDTGHGDNDTCVCRSKLKYT